MFDGRLAVSIVQIKKKKNLFQMNDLLEEKKQI